MDINEVKISGTIADEPRRMGKSGARLRLEVAGGFEDREGRWQDRKFWVTVKAWGQLGNEVLATVQKGAHVNVYGELRSESYEKDGNRVYETVVVAERVDSDGESQQLSDDESPF